MIARLPCSDNSFLASEWQIRHLYAIMGKLYGGEDSVDVCLRWMGSDEVGGAKLH
jgi:hypothetical protein